jgi:hypothetical protein
MHVVGGRVERAVLYGHRGRAAWEHSAMKTTSSQRVVRPVAVLRRTGGE